MNINIRRKHVQKRQEVPKACEKHDLKIDIDTETENKHTHRHEHRHLHTRWHIRNARVSHTRREVQHGSQPVLNFLYSLATLVIMKARPRLTEDKQDGLVVLFSEHIQSIKAEVTRYGTKETKYTNNLAWGLLWEHDDWLLRKKDRYE